MMLMQFIRKTAVGVAASLLVITLFSFGLAFGLQRVFGTPDAIKDALRQSGFYSNAVSKGLDQVQKNQTEGSERGNSSNGGDKEQIPVDRTEVQNIIKDAASPAFLQEQSENAIDSLYAWLRGDSATLTISVDLTDAKTRLANGLADYVTSRAASLPTCAAGQQPNEDVDMFNATCVPPGFNAEQTANEARDQILNGEFLKESTITASNLKNDKGQTLDQQLKQMPVVFQRANQGIYAAGVLALLLSAAIIFLSVNKRRGVRKVAITFMAVGAIVGLLGWISSIAVSRGTAKLNEVSSDNPFQDQLVGVAKYLVNDVRFWWMAFGITLVVIGVAKLVAMHFIKPASLEEPEKPHAPAGGEPTGEDAVSADTEAKTETKKPAATAGQTKSQSKRRLVQ